MFFYLLYKLGYILSNLLPLRLAYWLAERLSDIQYLVVKKDREDVAQNLSVVLKKDVNECRVLARKVFRNFGLYLVDFFRMANLDKKDIEKNVEIVGLENIKGVLREGKGIIALTAHIGNWEMGGVVMAIMGYDISAVALNHKHKNINEFFIRQRERKGLNVIITTSVMKRCVSTLKRKGILALVGDRDFTNSGIILDFFGIPTSIPKGPAMLSLMTDSPIVPGFFVRHGRFKYRFIFDNPIEAKEMHGVNEDEIMKELTKKFISVMEAFIRTYPEQWLLFRKFWEMPVDAFVL